MSLLSCAAKHNTLTLPFVPETSDCKHQIKLMFSKTDFVSFCMHQTNKQKHITMESKIMLSILTFAASDWPYSLTIETYCFWIIKRTSVSLYCTKFQNFTFKIKMAHSLINFFRPILANCGPRRLILGTRSSLIRFISSLNFRPPFIHDWD